VASYSEKILDDAVEGEKPLSLAGRFESEHAVHFDGSPDGRLRPVDENTPVPVTAPIVGAKDTSPVGCPMRIAIAHLI
jgi:hypothetical protein